MAKKGTSKKRAEKYDEKLAVKSTFSKLIKISVSDKKDKKVLAANAMGPKVKSDKKEK